MMVLPSWSIVYTLIYRLDKTRHTSLGEKTFYRMTDTMTWNVY
ncbi:hypothetical protein IIG_01692 [Bacillus cereus VD048]|uniref:Uncharacterized protein n=2 Tax=Bacillus cereus group TaxID=86661 RepID=J8EY12_BACCE|nr:hypothetical protein IIG_01692 [Bacillus cereus VD048]EJR41846.1 hypothetical protein III_02273 [Bacillus mycoides]